MNLIRTLGILSFAAGTGCSVAGGNSVQMQGDRHVVEPVRALLQASLEKDDSAFARLGYRATFPSTTAEDEGRRRPLRMGDITRRGCSLITIRQISPSTAEATGTCKRKEHPDFSWPFEFTFVVVDGQIGAVDQRPFEL